MKITEKTFDITTGLETISEREETDAELAERLEAEAEAALKAQALSNAEAAKVAALAKLAALGLTTDDLRALGL